MAVSDFYSRPADAVNSNILQIRTYDVMITYDKLYQTPRVWLLGYDEVCASNMIVYMLLTTEFFLERDTFEA